MAFGLANPLGILALAFLIPLIIIYLIRPQPKKLEIPSLMFLNKHYKKAKQHSFLRKLLKDPLFFLQLLVLIFLILSLWQPWIDTKSTISTDHTIIVLDVSASMQVEDRFELAKKQALKSLGGKNTIILAQTTPLIALQESPKSESKRFIKSAKATDGSTDLGNAIILASEFAKDEAKVVIISDFIHTQGISPLTAKSVLESKDIPVEFINVGKNSENNVAIIDANIDYEKTTLYIKNYNSKDERIKLKINNIQEEISLPAKTTETYSFKTPKGTTKIELQHEDDLLTDNIAYISNPVDDKIKVNLITNSNSRYLKSALESIEGVELTVSEPPIIKDGDFDVYIFAGIAPSKMVRGATDKILKKVESGEASAIIHSQKTIKQLSYGHLNPVKVDNLIQTQALVEPTLINTLTKDIEFGETRSYFSVENRNRVKTIASADSTPIVSEINFGGGHLVYFGIIEEESEFKLSPSYPIFWTRLLKMVSNKRDITDSNLKTGTTLSLKKDVVLDKIQTYKLGKSTIAANLFSDRESDLNIEKLQGTKIKEFEVGKTQKRHKQNLEKYLIIIAFLLFIGEFIYSKMRGEI